MQNIKYPRNFDYTPWNVELLIPLNVYWNRNFSFHFLCFLLLDHLHQIHYPFLPTLEPFDKTKTKLQNWSKTKTKIK